MKKKCKHPTCGEFCRREVKVKKPYKLKPVTPERALINNAYYKKAREFRATRELCEVRSPVCTRFSQGIHHMRGKQSTVMLMDETWWMSCCNACNTYIESHHEWAETKGFKLSKFIKKRALN